MDICPGESTTPTVSDMSGAEYPPRDFSVELRENYERYKSEISDFLRYQIKKYHREFQRTWRNDVENVLGLYRVRYDDGGHGDE